MAIKTVTKGTLEYLVARGIGVPHGFTTRFGGVSEGVFSSLNLTMHRGDPSENVQRNYACLAGTLGFDLDKLVLTRQIHSDIVRVVDRSHCSGCFHRATPRRKSS